MRGKQGDPTYTNPKKLITPSDVCRCGKTIYRGIHPRS